MGVRAERAAQTRQRILDAALTEYRERGIGQTSLQAVAHRADVSAATILNHFGSADDLAREVIARLAEALQIPDDRGWPERGRAPRVRRLAREMVEFYDRSAPWFDVFGSRMGVDPALVEGEADYRRAVRELFGRVFGGQLADPRLRGAVFGLTSPATVSALRRSGLSLDDTALLLANMLVRLDELTAPSIDE